MEEKCKIFEIKVCETATEEINNFLSKGDKKIIRVSFWFETGNPALFLKVFYVGA